jgi:ubiquitin-protein ligase
MQGYYKSATGFTLGAPFAVNESATLGLDISKSLSLLDWAPEMSLDKILFDLVDYFKRRTAQEPERDICLGQVREFFEL